MGLTQVFQWQCGPSRSSCGTCNLYLSHTGILSYGSVVATKLASCRTYPASASPYERPMVPTGTLLTVASVLYLLEVCHFLGTRELLLGQRQERDHILDPPSVRVRACIGCPRYICIALYTKGFRTLDTSGSPIGDPIHLWNTCTI